MYPLPNLCIAALLDVRESTFGVLVVGLYDSEGKPVYVAHVGLESLMANFKTLKTTPAPFITKCMEEVTWIDHKLVCEVIYQVVTRDCRLRMPRLHTLRIDREPSE